MHFEGLKMKIITMTFAVAAVSVVAFGGAAVADASWRAKIVEALNEDALMGIEYRLSGSDTAVIDYSGASALARAEVEGILEHRNCKLALRGWVPDVVGAMYEVGFRRVLFKLQSRTLSCAL